MLGETLGLKVGFFVGVDVEGAADDGELVTGARVGLLDGDTVLGEALGENEGLAVGSDVGF